MAQGNARNINVPIVMTGDVTGTLDNATVAKLKNVSVKSGLPSNEFVLQYVTANTRWEPTSKLANQPLVFSIAQPDLSSIRYTIGSSDTIIVPTNVPASGGSGPTNGAIYFPQTATIGRMIMIFFQAQSGSGQFSLTFATPGPLINGHPSITTGPLRQRFPMDIYVCVDGVNWQCNGAGAV